MIHAPSINSPFDIIHAEFSPTFLRNHKTPNTLIERRSFFLKKNLIQLLLKRKTETFVALKLLLTTTKNKI